MRSVSLGQQFDSIVRTHADRPAVRSLSEGEVSYSALNKRTNSIANYLLSKGLKEKEVVVILNNKTVNSYAIMLACLKIGAIYTNLDPKSPIERFNRMLDVCRPKFLFYFKAKNSVINEFSENPDIHLIDYSSEGFEKQIDEGNDQMIELKQELESDHPAYIMFTSGSTGFPKGVLISHQNISNFINWTKVTYSTSSADVFTNINPMHFDNSVFDFYASLYTGASIVPLGEELTRNPRKLLDVLNELKPTVWFSVPSMLVYMLNMRALKENDLLTLRVVTFGGEGFPKNQLRKLWSYWGHRVRFVNVYGPTECTCICSHYDVSAKDIESDGLLPLGQLSSYFYGLVLDEEGKEVQDNEVGELCLGGVNVGLGYYNNHEKTRELFVKNPKISKNIEILYKSGDLVRKDEQTGMFLFYGRKDHQIKRMGYRIELEEIENACNEIDLVRESAVIYVNNEKYPSKIIACLCTSKENETKIREDLRRYLPTYMLPDLYCYYEGLPKNHNGKIDRLTLKKQFNG